MKAKDILQLALEPVNPAKCKVRVGIIQKMASNNVKVPVSPPTFLCLFSAVSSGKLGIAQPLEPVLLKKLVRPKVTEEENLGRFSSGQIQLDWKEQYLLLQHWLLRKIIHLTVGEAQR